MEQPLISVGMPVYNGEEYLSSAIESILGQTHGNLELIIGDNGSDDGTQEICRHYGTRDQRVRYERSEANNGATWNYNRLLPLARGSYFRWAAADDLCDANHLEQCLAQLVENESAVLCFPRTLLIDDHDQPLTYYENRLTLDESTAHQRLVRIFRSPGLCNPIFGLIRTDILRHTVLIESYADSDRVLLGQLAIYGQFVEASDTRFLRRMHENTSVAANLDYKSRAAWFDPRKRERIQLPKWRRTMGYLSAVRRAQIGRREKNRCYQALAKHHLLHPKWMFTDFINATRQSNGAQAWSQQADALVDDTP